MKFITSDNLPYVLSTLKTKFDALFAPISHGTHLELGTGSGNAFRGDYGNTAYTHSQAAHAPSDAQKNSDITKAEIEAKLTGAITSHTHNTLSVKSDNYKKNTDLPSTYERGETLFFINNPGDDGKFNNLTYGMVQTLKEYGSGPAAWQFLYPYNDGDQDKFYVRNAKYGTDSWRGWAEIYTSLNKPTAANIGAAPTSHASTATTYGVSSASNYGHAMASGTTPKANGTAAVGSETAKFARGDHVHPLQTTVNGLSFWTGTQAQYDAISSKSSSTLYFIKE